MDKLTPEQRKRNMRANKGAGTSIETTLGKAMWEVGLRYRKNVKTIFGKPDFIFKGRKIAVFCDGEFWHGRYWEQRKLDHKSNKQFWISKIERNIERDREVTKTLQNDGWTVLRFWETDIKKNIHHCIAQVLQAYENANK